MKIRIPFIFITTLGSFLPFASSQPAYLHAASASARYPTHTIDVFVLFIEASISVDQTINLTRATVQQNIEISFRPMDVRDSVQCMLSWLSFLNA